MLSTYESTPRQLISGAAAVAVMMFAGLALDQGHIAAAPLGTVEVGELTPVGLEKLAQVTWPEIVVTAERPAPQGQRFVAHAKARRAGAVAAAAGTVR